MRLLTEIKSSNDSSIINIPVVLFRYGERRKFVRVSGDYEETIQTICRAFDIPTNAFTTTISLQTSVLEVCKGIDTVIDESAYPLLWNFIEEMSVVVEAGNQGPKSASDQNASELVTSSSSSPASSRKAEKARADPTPKPYLPTPSVEEDDSEERDRERERGTRNPDSTAQTRFPDDLLDFTSDHAHEEHDAQEKRWEEEEARLGEEKEEPITARADSPVHDDPPPPVSRTSNKKFKKPNGDGASSSSRVVDDIFSPIKQEKDNDSAYTSELSSRREREREQPRSPNKGKEPAQNLGPADDPRFEITIIGPDHTCAQFKTRGKHQVRKVLAAACKTFGVDVNRKELVLRVEIDEDEDEYHDYVCPPSETISGCGVNSDSKLFLKDIPEDYLD